MIETAKKNWPILVTKQSSVNGVEGQLGLIKPRKDRNESDNDTLIRCTKKDPSRKRNYYKDMSENIEEEVTRYVNRSVVTKE